MITIGIGNRKGGVGSTMLCYQLAALIQRAGCSVAIAETSLLGSDQLWCRGRSIREGRILNCTMKSVGYIFVDDYSDLRFADRWVGYDYVLLDYTNSRDDIELALRYVKHWICPLGPNESRPTMMVFDIWCDMRRLGRVAADTFCAVMNMTPNAEDIEEEPERADFRFNGDRSLEILAREAPLMKVLKRRIKNNLALDDSYDGRDVFSHKASEAEAEAGRHDIEAVWGELLQQWQQKGEQELPPPYLGIDLTLTLERFKRYMVGQRLPYSGLSDSGLNG